mgnify:CR=1 FL=1
MATIEYTVEAGPVSTRCDHTLSGNKYVTPQNRVFGTSGNTSSADTADWSIQWGYLYIKTSNATPAILTETTTHISKITVKAYGQKHSSSTENPNYWLAAPAESLSGTAEEQFYICRDAPNLGSYRYTLSSLTETALHEYITEDATLIENLIKRGVVVKSTDAPYSGNWKAFGIITKITFVVEYRSPNSSPEISWNANAGAVVPITDPYVLKWNYLQDSNTAQARIDVGIKYSSDTEFTVLEDQLSFSGTEYEISPSDFLPPQATVTKVTIRLRVYSSAGKASSYIERDVNFIFPTLTNLDPKSGEIKLTSSPIRLSWKSETLDENNVVYESINQPSEFDIQYSDNGEESWNNFEVQYTASKEGDTYYYDIPAYTLPPGIITWRVRPYANGYTINEYANELFVSRVQASTSSVTCDGKPLPTVSWTSSSQIAYQVRFADYDSGARYGTATSFTVPYFYADGYYPVQVRTQASDGTWSAWTELEYVQITNTAPSNTVTLTAVPTRHAVVLNWTDSGTAETYIVYRNHIPVYIGTDTSYTDIAANGECTYYVRAIQSKDYSQSGSVTVTAHPKTDCIYDFASMQWIPLKYSLQERSRNYSSSADVIFKNYAGRTKPVAFSSGHTVRQMSGAYVFKTREEALRLRNTVGKTVIFKDTRGGTIIGILNNPDITVQRKLYAVTFLVTETDYIEEREYASE